MQSFCRISRLLCFFNLIPTIHMTQQGIKSTKSKLQIILISSFEIYNNQKANIQRPIICFMLYHQHLKPWLLFYLLSTVFLFLSTIGMLVMIILNDINGFSFSKTIFSTCPPYTNLKVNMSMEIALQICFVMSGLVIVFSLGQCVVGIWQFVLFTKWSKDNDESQIIPFQSLSKKILILLYILNSTGFLALISIIGWFGTLFMQLSDCQGTQNQSDIFTLPTAIAGSSLIFQICSLSFLFKLFYHFYQDQDEQSSQDEENRKGDYKNKKQQFQTPQARCNRQKKELEQIKKRILQSKQQQNQFQNQIGNQIYKSHSTNEIPNTNKDGLLNKNQHQNKPDDHIFAPDSNKPLNQSQLKRKKKRKNKYPLHNNQGSLNTTNQDQNSASLPFQNSTLTPLNHNQTNSLENSPNQISSLSNDNHGSHPNINNSHLSPNQITQQQKSLMKTIPKNGYKKNKTKQNSPNDIIFQNSDQEDLNSITNHQPKKRNRPIQRFISIEQQQKAQIQIKKLKNIIDTISPNQKKYQNFDIFKTKYNHMMHLMKQQKSVVSNSERRCIKRQFLGIKSKIVQFDAKNYDIEEFMLKVEPQDHSPQKSNNQQQKIPSESKLQHKVQNNQNPKFQQGSFMNQLNLKTHPQTKSRIKPLKTAAQIWHQGFIEGKKAQYYNPIKDYVEQGEQYEETLKKILDFQQTGTKMISDQQYNPFEISNKQFFGQGKQKLYLHKNKPKLSRIQLDDVSEDYCDRSDPFNDIVFEEDWQIQRGLLVKDDTTLQNAGKPDKKGFIDGLFGNTHPKKTNRKEGGLVQLIRGKYPISFL